MSILRDAKRGDWYRAVIGSSVISGSFGGLDESHEPVRVYLAGKLWSANRIKALAPVRSEDSARAMPCPELGSIGQMTGIDKDWLQRLVAPAADLAIVGTKRWITDELEAVLTRDDDERGDLLKTLILPETKASATWFTRIYSASCLGDQSSLPEDVRLAILDGQGAIRHLNDVLTPIVVCVFDRTIADESVAELVVQLRNTRGESFSLSNQLDWTPPAGVEALGFTVAL